VQINPRLADTPQCIHLDPYGEGWIARIAPDDLPADLTRLVHGEGVADTMRRHADGQEASP
jgi:glycine cleavage system H protein